MPLTNYEGLSFPTHPALTKKWQKKETHQVELFESEEDHKW